MIKGNETTPTRGRFKSGQGRGHRGVSRRSREKLEQYVTSIFAASRRSTCKTQRAKGIFSFWYRAMYTLLIRCTYIASRHICFIFFIINFYMNHVYVTFTNLLDSVYKLSSSLIKKLKTVVSVVSKIRNDSRL